MREAWNLSFYYLNFRTEIVTPTSVQLPLSTILFCHTEVLSHVFSDVIASSAKFKHERNAIMQHRPVLKLHPVQLPVEPRCMMRMQNAVQTWQLMDLPHKYVRYRYPVHVIYETWAHWLHSSRLSLTSSYLLVHQDGRHAQKYHGVMQTYIIFNHVMKTLYGHMGRPCGELAMGQQLEKRWVNVTSIERLRLTSQTVKHPQHSVLFRFAHKTARQESSKFCSDLRNASSLELTKYYCISCRCSAVAMPIELSSYVTWSTSETVASVQPYKPGSGLETYVISGDTLSQSGPCYAGTGVVCGIP